MAIGTITAISAGIKVIGGISGRKKEKKAAKERRAIEAENRKNYLREVEESVSRTQESHADELGRMSTDIGASGFAAGSTLDKFQERTGNRQRKDIDWMKMSGASTSDIMSREADARYRASENQSKAGLINTVGGAFGSAAGIADSVKKFGW